MKVEFMKVEILPLAQNLDFNAHFGKKKAYFYSTYS